MNKCISWGTPHRCQQRNYAQTQPCRSSVIMFSGVCPHRDIHSLLADGPAVTASLSASQSAENTPHTKPDLSERSLAPNWRTFKHVNDYHLTRLIIKCAARIQTSTLSSLQLYINNYNTEIDFCMWFTSNRQTKSFHYVQWHGNKYYIDFPLPITDYSLPHSSGIII